MSKISSNNYQFVSKVGLELKRAWIIAVSWAILALFSDREDEDESTEGVFPTTPGVLKVLGVICAWFIAPDNNICCKR